MNDEHALPLKQISPASLVGQVLELVRARSIARERIDWEVVAPEVGHKAAGCDTLEQAHDVIRHLLARLGDGHSFLRTPGDMAGSKKPGQAGLRLHQEEPVVIEVFAGSPAAEQNVKLGDAIFSVDGIRVTSHNWRELRRAALRVNATLEIRDGTNQARAITLAGDHIQPPPEPSGRLLGSGIGLIDLPGHDGDGALNDGRQYGEVVTGFLKDLEETGATSWIVDLRRCDGGNMWPILAGLTPLLGIGHYGAFVDPVADSWFDWGFDGSDLQVTSRNDPNETYRMLEVHGWQPLRDTRAPVALLTSAVTSSSGEAVLISFLARDNTRSFGLPTGGLTTSNNLHVLGDGSWLLLAENLEADRNGEIYYGRIKPDEPVEIDWQLLGTEGDPVIRAAQNWLQGRR